MTRVGIYPGTFDPITKGHMDIIQRALPLVDRLVIAIAPNKQKSPLFTLEERIAFIHSEVAGLEAATVIEVTALQGLLVDAAKTCGAQFIMRGLRAVSDFEYECQMASMNKRLAPEIETVFLMASDRHQFVSSRFVREIASLGGDVSSLVSSHIMEALVGKFR